MLRYTPATPRPWHGATSGVPMLARSRSVLPTRLRSALLAVGLLCALAGAVSAADLFDELRSFAGTVLVPPDGMAPFAELRPYRVEIGRVRGTGPARGRYLIQYGEG